MRKIIILFAVVLMANVTFAKSKKGMTPEQVVYKTIDTLNLSMSIFKPSVQDPSKAAVVLIHGGGWNAGHPQAMFRHAQHFANRGLVVFCPQYRLRKSNGTTIVEAVEDALSAVAWVRSHAVEYGIDPNKIIVGGGSAGGHLAQETVFNKSVKVDGITADDYRANALILFNPVIDVSKRGYGHVKVAKEAKEHDITWESLSPIEHIDNTWPPTIVMIGDKDKVSKKEVVMDYKAKMEKAGVDFTLKMYPDAEHTFFNYGYANKKGYPKGTKNKYYYEVLQDVDDFLVDHGYIKEKTHIDIPADAVYPIKKDE